MNSPPLLILSPPRSFSSVACAMLGQHPQAYGFPELQLFVAATVAELSEILHAGSGGRLRYPLGLLRALAQLHDGSQTPVTVDGAIAWLDARRNWSTGRVFRHLQEEVAPRVAVEKSPQTACRLGYLRRALAACPEAKFLHLTRHPATALRSMREHFTEHFCPEEAAAEACAWRWLLLHLNILRFTRELPPEQCMRIRGEYLLSAPAQYLARIAHWAGLRSDPDAVACMLHPEASPYARPGPSNAPYGADPKWLSAPRLVRRPQPLPPLGGLGTWGLGSRLEARIVRTAAVLGYCDE